MYIVYYNEKEKILSTNSITPASDMLESKICAEMKEKRYALSPQHEAYQKIGDEAFVEPILQGLQTFSDWFESSKRSFLGMSLENSDYYNKIKINLRSLITRLDMRVYGGLREDIIKLKLACIDYTCHTGIFSKNISFLEGYKRNKKALELINYLDQEFGWIAGGESRDESDVQAQYHSALMKQLIYTSDAKNKPIEEKSLNSSIWDKIDEDIRPKYYGQSPPGRENLPKRPGKYYKETDYNRYDVVIRTGDQPYLLEGAIIGSYFRGSLKESIVRYNYNENINRPPIFEIHTISSRLNKILPIADWKQHTWISLRFTELDQKTGELTRKAMSVGFGKTARGDNILIDQEYTLTFANKNNIKSTSICKEIDYPTLKKILYHIVEHIATVPYNLLSTNCQMFAREMAKTAGLTDMVKTFESFSPAISANVLFDKILNTKRADEFDDYSFDQGNEGPTECDPGKSFYNLPVEHRNKFYEENHFLLQYFYDIPEVANFFWNNHDLIPNFIDNPHLVTSALLAAPESAKNFKTKAKKMLSNETDLQTLEIKDRINNIQLKILTLDPHFPKLDIITKQVQDILYCLRSLAIRIGPKNRALKIYVLQFSVLFSQILYFLTSDLNISIKREVISNLTRE